MYLVSSASFCYANVNFSSGHMSMDLSSVLATFTSHGVPPVTGTTIQVASPQGYTAVLAGLSPAAPSFTRDSNYMAAESIRMLFLRDPLLC